MFNHLTLFNKKETDPFTYWENWLNPYSSEPDLTANGEPEMKGFTPAARVHETSDHFVLELDIPGVDKKDIKLELKNDVLFISGERKFQKEENSKTHHFGIYQYGKFQRGFELPKGVQTDHIEALAENGVLQVVLPKLVKEETKKIEIKEGKTSFFKNWIGKKEETDKAQNKAS